MGNFKRRNEVDAFFWDGTREQGCALIRWVDHIRNKYPDIGNWQARFQEPQVYGWQSSSELSPNICWTLKLTAYGQEGLVMYGGHWLVFEPGRMFAMYPKSEFGYQFEKAEENE